MQFSSVSSIQVSSSESLKWKWPVDLYLLVWIWILLSENQIQSQISIVRLTEKTTDAPSTPTNRPTHRHQIQYEVKYDTFASASEILKLMLFSTVFFFFFFLSLSQSLSFFFLLLVWIWSEFHFIQCTMSKEEFTSYRGPCEHCNRLCALENSWKALHSYSYSVNSLAKKQWRQLNKFSSSSSTSFDIFFLLLSFIICSIRSFFFTQLFLLITLRLLIASRMQCYQHRHVTCDQVTRVSNLIQQLTIGTHKSHRYRQASAWRSEEAKRDSWKTMVPLIFI